MKKSFLAVCFFFPFSAGTVFSASVWAPGVSLDSGWFDTNKAYNPPIFFDKTTKNWDYKAVETYFPNSDYGLCWAATASNILEYMNKQAGNDIVYSSAYKEAEKIENPVVKKLVQSSGQYASYEKFTTYFKDDGFFTEDGLEWYTKGTVTTSNVGNLKDSANPGGGYYSDLVHNFQKDILAKKSSFWYTNSDIASMKESFKEAVAIGPVALSIYKVDGYSVSSGHAITSWGYETDDKTGDIIGIYITDSDDGPGEERLRLVELKENETGDFLALGGDLDLETKELISDSQARNYLYTKDGEYSGYATLFNNYSDEMMSILMLSSYNNFIPMAASVPEPSAFGLLAGFGALVLVVSRRRRRC